MIEGEMHVLRWRRGWFLDEVFFDDRRVATSKGFWGRETIFGLGVKTGADEAPLQLLLSIDPEESWNDWTGEGRPRGVRLETADTALVAFGTLGPDMAAPFRTLYDRAIKAIGLT